jgi:hypothetical protein
MWPRRHSRPDFQPEQIVAMIAQKSLDRVLGLPERRFGMMPTKTIAALASVAALACSIFAVSWIGLALLGF